MLKSDGPYTKYFHTLIIFLNCSSLMFMSSIGSRRGTPSGNRRITSCMDLPTLKRLSEDLRSLGRYSRMLLILAMCLSNTGTTYVLVICHMKISSSHLTLTIAYLRPVTLVLVCTYMK